MSDGSVVVPDAADPVTAAAAAASGHHGGSLAPHSHDDAEVGAGGAGGGAGVGGSDGVIGSARRRDDDAGDGGGRRARSLPPKGERFLSLVCGSLMYTSPEIIRGDGSPYLGRPVDIWSAGVRAADAVAACRRATHSVVSASQVLLYACVTGSFPFNGRNEEEVKARISAARLSFPGT